MTLSLPTSLRAVLRGGRMPAPFFYATAGLPIGTKRRGGRAGPQPGGPVESLFGMDWYGRGAGRGKSLMMRIAGRVWIGERTNFDLIIGPVLDRPGDEK